MNINHIKSSPEQPAISPEALATIHQRADRVDSAVARLALVVETVYPAPVIAPQVDVPVSVVTEQANATPSIANTDTAQLTAAKQAVIDALQKAA